MKKVLSISLFFFIGYVIFTFVTIPFMVSFGEASILKRLILLVTNFPISYSSEFSNTMFYLHIALNGAFWTLVLLILLFFKGKYLSSSKSSGDLEG